MVSAKSLRDTLKRTLLATLGGPQPVALVNFPNHGNPGDSAIWLGTMAMLEQIGCPVRYRSNFGSFDQSAFHRAHPEGPVLINGGGNFGDMYVGQQGLRERLIRDLRGRRLIQLPQSIHFVDQENVRRMAELIAWHGDVTLMLREDKSLEFATQNFDTELVLCPDMAFGLMPDRASVDPVADIGWILRSQGDPEWSDQGARPPCPQGIVIDEIDWMGTLPSDQASWEGRSRRMLALNRRLMRAGASNEAVHRWCWRALSATFDPLASAWVDRGIGLLGRGRIVVTDRLHGHILAVLLGMPHVIVNNSTGKVHSTFDTWTSGISDVVFAESLEAAFAAAIDLLEER